LLKPFNQLNVRLLTRRSPVNKTLNLPAHLFGHGLIGYSRKMADLILMVPNRDPVLIDSFLLSGFLVSVRRLPDSHTADSLLHLFD
jgi:hypothetical protein